MNRVLLSVCACLAVVAVGCGGGGSSSGGPPPPNAEAELKEFGGLLKLIAEQKRKPPAKFAELDQHEPYAMSAVKAIADKRIVYLYGQGYAAGDTDVVAYEATVEASGGFVLLQDGTVKKLTAAEFTAAPKAKAVGPVGKK